MSQVICPNESCLADVDVGDPFGDEGQYDEQETLMSCPVCGVELIITTHITYSAEVNPDVCREEASDG